MMKSATQLPLKSAPNAQACMLPIIAGFVGAATLGCILSTRIHESEKIRALVDIGKNGEVVIGSRERLTACSALAGPALEVAQIRYDMRGALGSIEQVEADKDIDCSFIGDVPAIEICGSGLIGAAAKMIDSGFMDCDGNMHKLDLEALPCKIRDRLTRGEKAASEFVLVRESIPAKVKISPISCL